MSTFSVFVNFSVDGSKKKVISGLTKNTTVGELIKKINDKEGGDLSIDSLKFRGKPLSDTNKTIGSYKIKKNSMILVAFRMKGGGEPRQFDIADAEEADVVVTKKKCSVIAYCYGTQPENNIQMSPCKHIYCSECAYGALNGTVKINAKSEVKCAVTGCNKVLDIDDLMFAAALSEDEEKDMENQLNVNCISYECPNKKCKALLSGKGIKVNKVQCTKCKGDWFCKVCNIKWPKNNYSYTDCGNEECTSGPRLFEMLDNCDLITKGVDKDVPKERLCIGCGKIDSWVEACKHRTCKFCGQKYCHVCLAPNHGCKLDKPCKIADTQSLT